MNPSFLKVMYFVNLVIGIVFVSSLRPFFGLGCLVMFSSAMGHFEPSLPVITENEQFIGADSSIPLRIPGGEAGASSSQGRDVILEGRPIKDEDTWGALASPFYMSKVVHIDGEVEDPLTLKNLGKLNGLLLYISDKFLGEWNQAI